MEEEQHPRKAKINYKKSTSVEIDDDQIPGNVIGEDNLNNISTKQTKKQKYGNRNKSVVAANFLRRTLHNAKDISLKPKKNKFGKKFSVVDPNLEDIDTQFMKFNKSQKKKKAKKTEEKKVSSRRYAKKKQKDLFYSKSKNEKINSIIEDLRKKQEIADEIRYANDNVGKLKIKIESNKKNTDIGKANIPSEKIIAPKIQEKIEKIGKKHKKNKNSNENIEENINENYNTAPQEFDSEKDDNNLNNNNNNNNNDDEDYDDDEIERLKAEIRKKEEEIEKLKRERGNYKPVKRVTKLKPVRYNSFVLVEEVIGENGENINTKSDKKTKKNNNVISKGAAIEINKKNDKQNQNVPQKKYSNVEYQNFNFCYYKIPEESYESKNYKKIQKYEPQFQTSIFLLRDYSDSENEDYNENRHKKSIKIKKPTSEKKDQQTQSMPINKKPTNNKKKSIIENKLSIKKNQNILRSSGKLNNKRASSSNKGQSVKDFIKSRRKELFEQEDNTLKNKQNLQTIQHPENEIIEDDEGVKYMIFRKTHLTKIRKGSIHENSNENNVNDEIYSDIENDNESEENNWLYKEFVISHQVSITLKAIKETEELERRIKNHILVIHNNKVPTNVQKNINKKINANSIPKQNIKLNKKLQNLKLNDESEESSEEEENENENNINITKNKNIITKDNKNNQQKKIQPPKKLIYKNPILTNDDSDSDEEEEIEEIEQQPKVVKKPLPPIDKKKLYKKFNDLLLTYEDKRGVQTEPNEVQTPDTSFPQVEKKVVIKDEDYYKHNKTIYSDIYNKEPKRMMDFKKKLSNNKFRKDNEDADSKLNTKKVKSKKAKIKILVKDEKYNKKKHYYDDTDNSKIRKNLSSDKRYGDQQNFQLYGKVYSGSTIKKGRNQNLTSDNTYYPTYENPIEAKRKFLTTAKTNDDKLNNRNLNNSTGKKYRGRK